MLSNLTSSKIIICILNDSLAIMGNKLKKKFPPFYIKIFLQGNNGSAMEAIVFHFDGYKSRLRVWY